MSLIESRCSKQYICIRLKIEHFHRKECKRNERRNWNTKGKKKLIMHEFFNKLKKII